MPLSIWVKLAGLLAATGIGASLMPAATYACPFCYAASDPRTLHAFYVSTAALTLMPLLLIGGFAFWISRAYGARAGVRRLRDAAAARRSRLTISILPAFTADDRHCDIATATRYNPAH